MTDNPGNIKRHLSKFFVLFIFFYRIRN
jgi:hypothetical protein